MKVFFFTGKRRAKGALLLKCHIVAFNMVNRKKCEKCKTKLISYEAMPCAHYVSLCLDSALIIFLAL